MTDETQAKEDRMNRAQLARATCAVDLPSLSGRNVVLRPLHDDDVERVIAIQSEAGVARWWGH